MSRTAHYRLVRRLPTFDRSSDFILPNGIYLAIALVISTHVPPSRLVNPGDIPHGLNHRRANVDRKVGPVVMAVRMPTLFPVVLVNFAAIHNLRRRKRNQAEVVEQARCR